MSGMVKSLADGTAFTGKTTKTDVTPEYLKPLQNQQAGFLQGVYNGESPFANVQNAMATQGQNAMMQGMGGANAQVNPMLQQMMTGAGAQAPQAYGGMQATAQQAGMQQMPGAYQAGDMSAYTRPMQTSQYGVQPHGFNEMQFQQWRAQPSPYTGNDLAFGKVDIGPQQFDQMRNPYGDMGAMNPAYAQLAAMTPIFDRNLQAAQTQLSNAAPGRFSSAFVQQGQDLASTALQDYNLFAQQALQKGQDQQLQQQQANLNFQLGARGLQQDAVGQHTQNYLQSQGLFQEGALGARGLGQQNYATEQGLNFQGAELQQQSQLQARQLQQQIQAQYEQMGLDSHTAAQQAALQAHGMGQQAMLGQGDQMLQARGQDIQGASAMNDAMLGRAQMGNTFGIAQQGMQQDAWAQQQQMMQQYQQMLQQGQLGAANLMQQGGQNAFQNAATANQLGQAAMQQQIDPMLALMQGGLQYGAPFAQQVTQSQGWLPSMIGAGIQGFGMYQNLKGMTQQPQPGLTIPQQPTSYPQPTGGITGLPYNLR